MDHYGIGEYWTLPTDGKGDCEDYALLKRHELIRLGWPSSALLMTVVMDEIFEGHAVLTVRTTAGDFILDNKVNDVRLCSNTSYQYLLRQSYSNPQAWVFLNSMRGTTPRPIAVVQFLLSSMSSAGLGRHIALSALTICSRREEP